MGSHPGRKRPDKGSSRGYSGAERGPSLFMSFDPGIGGGISNVQCSMILTHGGGLAHQLVVIWPGEFDFEVNSQFWSDAWALSHRHGGCKGWIYGSRVLHGIRAQNKVI